MIRNVLVAVDGSENSDRALDFALDLAEKYGAAVTILNVSESPCDGCGSFGAHNGFRRQHGNFC